MPTTVCCKHGNHWRIEKILEKKQIPGECTLFRHANSQFYFYLKNFKREGVSYSFFLFDRLLHRRHCVIEIVFMLSVLEF